MLDGHIGAFSGSVTVAYNGEPWKPEHKKRPTLGSSLIGFSVSMKLKTSEIVREFPRIVLWFTPPSCKFLHLTDFQCPHAYSAPSEVTVLSPGAPYRETTFLFWCW